MSEGWHYFVIGFAFMGLWVAMVIIAKILWTVL